MARLTQDFDRDEFMRYYISIDGRLDKTDFYGPLIDGLESNKILIHNMFGVLTDDPPRINNLAFYENWSSSSRATTYAESMFTHYMNDVSKFSIYRAFLQQMSSFLIQYYFNFKKSATDFLPQVVSYKRRGYFIQTANLQSFFKDERTRGIGNLIISSMCTKILERYENVNDKRTYVSVNPELLSWCGCFAPPDPVMESLPPDEGGGENFPMQCDPLCVSSSSIKLFDINGGDVLKCTSAVCVLSNIALNVEGSTNQTYNFRQICSACLPTSDGGDDPCRCIVDTEFVSMLSKIGADDPDGRSSGMDVSTTFERYCPNSVCIVIDHVTNQSRVVECNEFNPSVSGFEETNFGTGKREITIEKGVPKGFGWFLVSILGFFILMVLMLLIRKEVSVKVSG